MASEHEQQARLNRFNFNCINEFATTLRDLWIMGYGGEERGPEGLPRILNSLRSQSQRVLSGKLSVRGDHQFKSRLIETLHLTSLSIQVLSIGLLSYFQAHIGEIRPFFLDFSLRKLLLLGLKSPLDEAKSWFSTGQPSPIFQEGGSTCARSQKISSIRGAQGILRAKGGNKTSRWPSR
ncbi:hypothetical protein CGCF413_v001102 [Colletotrichum fructicola]|nr:hypothetical protein CGCF413_v001102 [Colletotrichum fructicola]